MAKKLDSRRRTILSPGELGTRMVPLAIAALRSPNCGECKLYQGCITPKMAVKGKGQKGIAIIGEAPGETEDQLGKPFVGMTGQHLRTTLSRLGVDLFRDCWVMNALSCRPARNKISKDEMIDWCRPKVLRHLHELKPHTIILLGGKACHSVIGWLWNEDASNIMRWAGWGIPSRRLNAWIHPTFHPSFVLRDSSSSGGRTTRRGSGVAQVIWERHLEAALQHRSVPYPNPLPDPEALVQRIIDPNEGATALLRLASGKQSISFDYETDRLKPEHHLSRIISVAFSDGERAVACPWHGAVIEASKQLLASPIGKIAHNAAFELKWSSKIAEVKVENLILDTMMAAHTLNNQEGTKGLKFLAFVKLGVDRYDDHLAPYMDAESGNSPNNLFKVKLDKLLLYNGLDALYTHQLALILGPQVGVKV